MTAAGASAASPRAATPTFSARGSAEQVYVTGLAPNARVSLLSRQRPGRSTPRPPTPSADCCSATCRQAAAIACACTRRNRVGPLTVHSNAAAPWDPGIYNQSIPDNGYTYLTTRDGTQLAIDVHPPTSPAGEPGLPGTPGSRLPIPGECRLLPALRSAAVPHADRVLRLRLCRPGGPGERHCRPRQPDGLCGRRRQHARNGLLWRGI